MLPSSLIFQTKKKERKKERELNEVSLEEKNDVKNEVKGCAWDWVCVVSNGIMGLIWVLWCFFSRRLLI